jgi:hypothetical protein
LTIPPESRHAVIRIPPRLDYDTFENIFLREFKQVMESRSENITFDLSHTRSADLMEAMALGIAAQYAISEGRHVAFDVPTRARFASSDTVRNFLQDWYLIGAWKRTGAEVPSPQYDTLDTERLLPVTDLADITLANLTQELRSRIQFYFPTFPQNQVESLVDAIVFEASENALLHAYDPTAQPGTGCRYIAVRHVQARHTTPETDYKSYWIRTLQHLSPNSDFLEIIVADGGVGIYTRLHGAHQLHLKRNIPDRDLLEDETSEPFCIAWALSEHRSSHLTGPRRGQGLFRIVSHAVNGWNGAFYLRTGTTRVACLPNLGQTVDHGVLFPGTQIRVFLPIQNRESQLADVNFKLARIWESEN